MIGKRLWISWETQRRNAELADAFGCDYVCFDDSALWAPLRYFVSTAKTAALIIGKRYDLVFAQCPSLGLTLALSFLRKLRKFHFVIDAHNVGVEYLEDENELVRRAAEISFRSADLTIVSNEALVAKLAALGLPAAALPDRLPTLHPGRLSADLANLARPLVVLIATFAHDEPLAEFLDGAAMVEENFTLVVTGKRSRAGELLLRESDRLRFSDFLPADQYDALISSADLLVDITDRHDCLVCGAYEAVAAAVPIVLLDSEVNRQVFSRGCLYAENSAESYRAALEAFLKDPEPYRREVAELRRDFPENWARQFELVKVLISEQMARER